MVSTTNSNWRQCLSWVLVDCREGGQVVEDPEIVLSLEHVLQPAAGLLQSVCIQNHPRNELYRGAVSTRVSITTGIVTYDVAG